MKHALRLKTEKCREFGENTQIEGTNNTKQNKIAYMYMCIQSHYTDMRDEYFL